MDGRISPASSSSSAAGQRYCGRRRGQSPAEDDGGGADHVACTGKSCQSCTAGVIADCVAVCCCPCAVVNILTLAFVKLPWAVARRCIGGGRRRRRRMLEEKRNKHRQGGMEVGAAGKGREEADDGASASAVESVFRCGGAVAGEEEVWWELYEVGHLGFGRVSFTGISFQSRGN